MTRQGSARWEGALRDGKGTLTTESGVLLKTPYSYPSRFENSAGTNPEELLAAAHAGCFTMALTAQLGSSGVKPDSIYTTATVTLEKQPSGYMISGVHLDVTARIPGIDALLFERAAAQAKSTCPVSTALKTKITLEARLSAM